MSEFRPLGVKHPVFAADTSETIRWLLAGSEGCEVAVDSQTGERRDAAHQTSVDVDCRSPRRRRWDRGHVVAAGACTVFALWLVVGFGGPRITLIFVDLALVVLPMLTFASCARTGARSSGAARWAWWLLGLSCASWGAGQAAWSVYEIALNREVPFPSLADVGYLGSYPLALAGVLLLPSRRVATVSRLRAMCDGLIVSGSVLFASWAVVLGPTYRDSSGPLLMHVLGLAYPIADVVVISVALAVARRSAGRSRVSIGFIASGLIAIAVSDTAFAYFTSTGSYATGNLIDIGWFVGFVLIALAARSERAVAGASDADADNPSGRSLLVYGPTLVVAFGQAHERLEPFLAVLGAAIFVLVVVRQLATNAENVSLTSDLRVTVDELRSREERFDLVARATRDVVWDMDLRDRSTWWGDGVQELFGYRPDDVKETYEWWSERVHPSDRERVEHSIDDAIASGAPLWLEEYRFSRADRSWATIIDRGFVVRDDAGVPVRMVGAMTDITDRKMIELELAHRATHDGLTGLPNRVVLVEHLHRAATREAPTGIAVLFLDIDHFKRINDTYGHAAGDEVLIQTGVRLRGACRPSDLIARFAGDEFVVVCDDIEDEDGAVRVADRIVESLRQPLVVHGKEIRLSASVGIAFDRDGARDPDEILHDADLALFEAKARGRARHLVYSDALRGRGEQQMEMADALQRAIEEQGLTLAYQPVIDIPTGRAVGVEALARWVGPDGTSVPPTEFISIAEENGLIQQLGAWVLESSCRDVSSWSVADDTFALAVNVSPLQLNDNLLPDVRHALRVSGLRPSQLCLEITEGAIMAEPVVAVRVLQSLRDIGVKLAIDDFGTGQSSLAYLKDLPIDCIKIDRTFIAGLGDDGRDDAIVAAVVGIGRAGNLAVIAEGVENELQAQHLAAIGCPLAQGFHFARPGHASAIAAALAERDRAPAATQLASVLRVVEAR